MKNTNNIAVKNDNKNSFAKFVFLVCLFTFLKIDTLNAQNFAWALKMGGISGDNSYSIAVDATGNVYTCGHFTLTADFDPGPGAFSLTSSGYTDIFISKLDVSGNFIWAKQIGGTDYDNFATLAVDASGNVYITGYFFGTIDFDPGPGAFYLSSGGHNQTFVSKLDASGNFVWAKTMVGSSWSGGTSIAVDILSNVYTTGSFQGIADFDPSLTANYYLTAVGFYDIFISKLDSLGNFVFAKSMGANNEDAGCAIAFDNSGNIYTAGYFTDTVDFDPGGGTFNLIAAGGNDIFISKLDAAGNFVWANGLGGITSDRGYSIAVDAIGNLYTTGSFSGTADFDPGAGSFNLASSGMNDIFISKIDSSGNFVWAKGMGGMSDENGSSIAIDASGNIYTTGSFIGTADFDPGAGLFNLSSNGGQGIFISKLDASGNFVWANAMIGQFPANGNSIALDAFGNIYTTGDFYSTTDFDPGVGTSNLTPAGSDDVFICKLSTTVGINEELPDKITPIKILSNPNNGNFTLWFSVHDKPDWLDVYDVNGNLILHEGVAPWSQYKQVDISPQPNGIYFCKMQWKDGEGSVKVIKN